MLLLSLSEETKWGFGVPIQVLRNAGYHTCYCYLTMQPRYVLQELSADELEVGVDRQDVFREDDRIPPQFRQTAEHYRGSGYDRGHLAPSADQRTVVENSASFLLSNMCPQRVEFNRGVWKHAETDVRQMVRSSLQVWCCSGPAWLTEKPIQALQAVGKRSLPIPHAFWKSVLTESRSGLISAEHWWFDHETDSREQISLNELERRAGLQLWTQVQSRERIQ